MRSAGPAVAEALVVFFSDHGMAGDFFADFFENIAARCPRAFAVNAQSSYNRVVLSLRW